MICLFKKYKPYIVSVLIALAVGGLSALATKGNMDIYSEIVKPPLSPPTVLFPIVWSVLYVLMGISAGRIYVAHKCGNEDACSALTVYAINLAVNFLWSILFFNLRIFLISAVWLALLIAIIITMIVKFKNIVPWTGWLQIPYLVWCCFALYLNIAIYILN